MEARVMLVLSRKQSERIRLGKDIVVTVVRVAGDKVRLGIEAPADIVVLRDELQTHRTSDAGSERVENPEIGSASG
jgi:carbon storage regulator